MRTFQGIASNCHTVASCVVIRAAYLLFVVSQTHELQTFKVFSQTRLVVRPLPEEEELDDDLFAGTSGEGEAGN